MKSFKLTIMTFLLLGFMACNKNNTLKPNPTPANNQSYTTSDQAAALVSSSLAINANGAFSSFADITAGAQLRVRVDSLCGTTWTDSISRKSPSSSAISYNYSSKYTYVVTCSDTSKANFSGTVTTSWVYSGNFDGPQLSSSNSGNSNFVLNGLGPNSANYTLNGEYKRSGMFQSKVDTAYAGSSNIDVKFTNLKLTKPFQRAISGTATFTISGAMPKKGSFNFTGTLVFNGDNTATLTVNGTIYTVNLISGACGRRR